MRNQCVNLFLYFLYKDSFSWFGVVRYFLYRLYFLLIDLSRPFDSHGFFKVNREALFFSGGKQEFINIFVNLSRKLPYACLGSLKSCNSNQFVFRSRS